MSSLHHPSLERIGLRAAASLDAQMDGDTDAILAGVHRKQKRAKQRRVALVSTAMSALVVLLVAFFAFRQTPPAAPALGERNAVARDMPVAFSDGSKVVLKQGTQATLRETQRHGAVLAIDHGTADVHVVHFDDTRWDVLAGPFDVKVTGTRFDATWDPQAKKLTVAMKEGSVQVSGPCVDERLVAPNTKTFSCETERAPAPTAAPTTVEEAPTSVAPPKPAAETVAALFTRADEARLAGDPATAQRLYKSVRDRHPRSAEAAKAAFLLGRIAESNGSLDEAARWYETVTHESPQSAYAQDALGRSMELAQKRGDQISARALADQYLKKHPTGPHRAYATSILEAP